MLFLFNMCFWKKHSSVYPATHTDNAQGAYHLLPVHSSRLPGCLCTKVRKEGYSTMRNLDKETGFQKEVNKCSTLGDGLDKLIV